MPHLDNNEVYCDEVQEVMGKIPSYVIRSGSALIFIIITFIIIGAYFFTYHEVVTAPILITTYNTPAILEAKVAGQIEKLFVYDEQIVERGQRIGIIRSTLNYDHLCALENQLAILDQPFCWNDHINDFSLNSGFVLGELQSHYTSLQKIWTQYQNYMTKNYLPIKLKLLEEQIGKQKEINFKQLQQLKLQEKDLSLSQLSYQRDSLLYFNEKDVITAVEHEKSLQLLIQKHAAFKGFENALKSNEATLLKLKESKVDLQLQFENEIEQHHLALHENYQLLRASIDNWKDRYLIVTPIKGKITFTNFWNTNQVIKSNERLATVIPTTKTKIIARAMIAPANLGKVEKGQLVYIKLSGYPFMEYGMLKGIIKSISLVPEKNAFVAQIELSGGMNSTYKQKLKFVQEMDGTAEIVTKKVRLIYLIINPLKALLDKRINY